MKQKRKTIKYLPFIFLVILVILIYRHLILENRLKNNYKVSFGTVYKNLREGKGDGVIVHYQFRVFSKVYKGARTFQALHNDASILLERTFPVIYDTNNIENCDILIQKRDFDKYEIPYPDSLNWVQPYFEK